MAGCVRINLLTNADRDEVIRQLWRLAVIVLPTGNDGVQFRPAFPVSRVDSDAAIAAVCGALQVLTRP